MTPCDALTGTTEGTTVIRQCHLVLPSENYNAPGERVSELVVYVILAAHPFSDSVDHDDAANPCPGHKGSEV